MKDDKTENMKHTFAICAYGDSPYLEDCIRSVTEQSEVIMCTSTPSEYISDLAEKYSIPLFVREGAKGIAYDWNFAYKKAESRLVTIAHQDDVYSKNYVDELMAAKGKYPDMSVFMTSSVTSKNGKHVFGSVEMVKKLLRLPLSATAFADRRIIKKAALRFGNPVICPSCTYDKLLCGEDIFDPKYHFVTDWDALLRLADKKGRFVCCEKPLIMYRVHGDSETARSIVSHLREKEEAEMFARVLPKGIAAAIGNLYRKSYDAYK